MADMKKCDKCGKIYDECKSGDRNFKIDNKNVFYVSVFDANNNSIMMYDICDDCLKEMFDFIAK